jgi:fructokinase
MDGNKKYLWGIDLGGTKIECVVLPEDNLQEPVARHRVATGAENGYSHIITQIMKLVKTVSEHTGIKPGSIGFGTPGSLEPATQTMKNCNTTCLNGRALKKDLEAALGLKIKIANDANCFALAETLLGAVPRANASAEVVFGVIMGTGVGGGIVVNGKVLNGKQGIAGEWGHNFLDESGGPCYCGKTGCVETVISGPALERYYFSISGEKRKLKEIMERHEEYSDLSATQTVKRMTDMFGKAIASVINILDPDMIVLGGGLSNIGLLYTEGAAAAAAHVFNTRPDEFFQITSFIFKKEKGFIIITRVC